MKPHPTSPEREVHRNSPERAQMLAKRAIEQRSRRPYLRMIGVPASINRRTGKPHEHARAKKRGLAFVEIPT